MTNKSVWKALAGLVAVGAAVGGAYAYYQKMKNEKNWEDEFDEFMDELEDEEEVVVSTEPRSYTTLPKETTVEEAAEEENVSEEIAEDTTAEAETTIDEETEEVTE